MEPRKVYLDNSATSKVDKEVLDTMLPYFTATFGNPNSFHDWGLCAREGVENARQQVADLIGANKKDIIFTGSGTEADNLAIKGTAWARREKGGHIITSPIEHHAVLDTVKWLSKNYGIEYTIVPVDKYGRVNPADVEAAIRPDTFLISIMFANNEIGTVQPIKEIGEICKAHKILFHTDAVQAAGHIAINVDELHIDMMTMAAHKMRGPKGVGALYVRKGLRLVPLIHGGGQEFGLRSGTENAPGIVGFGKAAELAAKRLESGEPQNEAKLRDKLLNGLEEKIPDILITGSREHRLPYHASVCIRHIEGEGILLLMNSAGIAVSSGSACTSASLEPSYVLLATGLDHETAHGSVRLTLSPDTTEDDIDYVLQEFPKIVARLREISPFYHES